MNSSSRRLPDEHQVVLFRSHFDLTADWSTTTNPMSYFSGALWRAAAQHRADFDQAKAAVNLRSALMSCSTKLGWSRYSNYYTASYQQLVRALVYPAIEKDLV